MARRHLATVANLLVIYYLGLVCGPVTSASSGVDVDPLFELSVVHLNDLHARFEETSLTSDQCRAGEEQCVGGVARLYTAVNSLLASRPNSIFLNAGDNYQGTLWYSLFKWRLVAHFMNRLPHDALARAWCLASHESTRVTPPRMLFGEMLFALIDRLALYEGPDVGESVCLLSGRADTPRPSSFHWVVSHASPVSWLVSQPPPPQGKPVEELTNLEQLQEYSGKRTLGATRDLEKLLGDGLRPDKNCSGPAARSLRPNQWQLLIKPYADTQPVMRLCPILLEENWEHCVFIQHYKAPLEYKWTDCTGTSNTTSHPHFPSPLHSRRICPVRVGVTTVTADEMTLGNHEFDDKLEGLVPFLQNFQYPVVVCNIDDSDEPSIQGLYNKSVVIQRGGRLIGVVGYITTTTKGTAAQVTGISDPSYRDQRPQLQGSATQVTGISDPSDRDQRPNYGSAIYFFGIGTSSEMLVLELKKQVMLAMVFYVPQPKSSMTQLKI
ncbi:hypothetical protein PR048_032928 [Dryococelus australis]|uniref:Calcineurin-like phosphoesterase domain-containing protein n=1 Tax=Dryococelus australis TaxID=614101 RepID=A0ABQ9G3L6_9NEOP|nr:hypothetical protein PR048_032928 [Dryococelus australis]